MLNNPTLSSLRTLGCNGMADAFTEQLDSTQFAELSFEERFAHAGGACDEDVVVGCDPLGRGEAHDLGTIEVALRTKRNVLNGC